jgi:hypothetical protein
MRMLHGIANYFLRIARLLDHCNVIPLGWLLLTLRSIFPCLSNGSTMPAAGDGSLVLKLYLADCVAIKKVCQDQSNVHSLR